MGCGATTSRVAPQVQDEPPKVVANFHHKEASAKVAPASETSSPAQAKRAIQTGTETSLEVAGATMRPASVSSQATAPSSRSAVKSFTRLFRAYHMEGSDVEAPRSVPQYDPLLEELYATKSSPGRPAPSAEKEPLVSPKYVMLAAEILGVDLIEDPFLVPPLKLALPTLAAAFQRGELNEDSVDEIYKALASARASAKTEEAEAEEGTASAAVQNCEECSAPASWHCPACEGSFCGSCFDKLHARGRRAEHPRLDLAYAGFKMKGDEVRARKQRLSGSPVRRGAAAMEEERTRLRGKQRSEAYPLPSGEKANGSAASSSRRKPLKLDLGNLTEKNIGQLKKLNTYTFPVTYKDQFYEDLKKRLEYCRLGFYADVLVGSICCRPEERKEGGKALYIMTLSVLKPYRGRSLASQLVQWIVDKAQKEESVKDDVREVYLHVQTSNKTALNFYHKFDFKVTEEIKDYYQNIDPPDCYVLRRPVNGHELSQEVMNIGIEP